MSTKMGCAATADRTTLHASMSAPAPNVDLELAHEEARLLAALRADPHAVGHYRALSALQVRRGRPGKALLAMRQALKFAPRSSEVALQAAALYVDIGEWSRATAHFRRALALGADSPDVYAALVRCQLAARMPEAAAETLTRLRERHPEDLQGALVAAHLARSTGRLTEAAQKFSVAVERAPDCGEAWLGWTDLDMAAAAARGPSPALWPDGSADLDDALGQFARGHLEDHAGRYDLAFAAYLVGNATLARHWQHHGIAHPQRFVGTGLDLRRLFPHAPARRPVAQYGTTPLFLVGLPRAGGSLTEQILARHPHVHAGGELGKLSELFEEFCELRGSFAQSGAVETGRDGPLLDEMRERYVEHLFGLGLDRPLVTDKFPGNYRLIGFAQALFPEACFVHYRRDPIATLWSLFSTPLPAASFHDGSLEGLWRVHAQYAQVMRDWRARIPLIEVHYEQLVSAPEAEIRALLAHCGLPWHPDCLTPEAANSPVTTASAAQVRRPIYCASLERWRPYAAWLTPWLQQVGAGNAAG